MAIKELVDFIGQTNITDKFKDKELADIGNDVITRFEQDLGTMKDWKESVDFGLKLVKQELHGRSTPWENASNFKSPILTEAALAFGNRSSLEILRARNLVKTDVLGLRTQGKAISRQAELVSDAREKLTQQQEAIQEAEQQGQQTPPETTQELQEAEGQIAQEEQALDQRRDAMRDKQERADRVTEVMNYQVNYEMKEWRRDQKRLLYTIPNVGTMFKKTVFDPLLGRNISHVIHYPDFVVNQATTHIDTARSFTHILDVSQNKVFENQQSGIWRDIELYPKDSEGDKGSNEEEEVTKATDNPNRILEQYCFADLDDDGYEEPYTITVHEATRQVVRIVARYDENSVMVIDENDLVLRLFDVIKARTVQKLQGLVGQAEAAGVPREQALQLATESMQDEDPDFKGLKLTRIEASQPIVKYGFIPSMDGTFLDLGYFHLIGGITQAVNATTNQLIDAGTLSNRQSGLLAKGFRKKMGPISFRPGEFRSTELSPTELANGIMPLPIKEPSQTLMILNENLTGQGRQFAQSVDATGQIQSMTAPTTALAIIQEQLIPLSALMGKIIDSMSDEFQKLFELNKKFIDPEVYKLIIDDDQADPLADFSAEGFDIIPTANAEMSSKMQRIQVAQVQMEVFDRVLQSQGNPIPLVKSFFEAIGSEITDEVFPDEAKMSAEDRQALDAVRQQEELGNQLKQEANELTKIQVELLTRAEDRRDRELVMQQDKAQVEIEKILADIVLTLEKAETEETKNQISIYTAQLDEVRLRLQASIQGNQ